MYFFRFLLCDFTTSCFYSVSSIIKLRLNVVDISAQIPETILQFQLDLFLIVNQGFTIKLTNFVLECFWTVEFKVESKFHTQWMVIRTKRYSIDDSDVVNNAFIRSQNEINFVFSFDHLDSREFHVQRRLGFFCKRTCCLASVQKQTESSECRVHSCCQVRRDQ